MNNPDSSPVEPDMPNPKSRVCSRRRRHNETFLSRLLFAAADKVEKFPQIRDFRIRPFSVLRGDKNLKHIANSNAEGRGVQLEDNSFLISSPIYFWPIFKFSEIL